MMDKYVKLDAIARLAKPMEELHKNGAASEGEGEYGNGEKMGEHAKCECPCCGAPCESCNEAEMEDSEEDTVEDTAEGESPDSED